MKDIIIGDEHCRGKFVNIYNKIKDDKNIRYIICVGDYFDPYEDYILTEKLDNFNAIVAIARNDNRVKLLLGNHDIHYLIPTGEKSRISYMQFSDLNKAFVDNLDLFQLAVELGDTVVSHAGISPIWIKKWGFTSIEEINDNLVFALNENSDKYNSDISKTIRLSLRYYEGDFSGYGDDARQSPTWIRPASLIEQANEWNWKIQIVGHTRTDTTYTKDYFLNPLNVVNYNELKFNGEVEILNVRNSDKSVVMVDTGENLDTYYVREF